ncbi:MAG: cyclodeaminase/cyclohydrolase family protein [Bryobacteraceae bacterium]
MTTSIWSLTLDDFQRNLASTAPAPAGVSLAAATATFALNLLVKTLAIAARHKDAPEDARSIQNLIEEATGMSTQLARSADLDAVAFDAYINASRLPTSTDAERESRAHAIGESRKYIVDVPLTAARLAAAGIDVCERSVDLLHAFVIADLGAATALLAGAVTAILGSLDYNLRQLPSDDGFRIAAETEREAMQLRVLQLATRIQSRIDPRNH